ncbi:MAG: thiamine-phosphate kinase [Deltaproteobacteria bacterium]|nr:thiamine-phosphate kinase [Deltaproteobacteria bacterium]
MRLKDIGEDRLIKAIARRFSSRAKGRLIRAIGDDTSVSLQKGGLCLLATTDTLIGGTHYLSRYTPSYLLGRKALSISLSDIAAMGGTPLFFLVSAALRAGTDMEFIYGLYRGLMDVAGEFGVGLAGGNTVRTRGPVSITTTLFGEMPEGKAVYRSGARTGDTIYVTGTLGDSALGRTALKRYGLGALKKRDLKKAALRHLAPAPRVHAGRLLADKGIASSMIDISDGLMLDLKRLCEESGRGAEIDVEMLPLSPELRRHIEAKGRGIMLALTGGEDYELLFSAPYGKEKAIEAVSRRLKLRITPIGRITGRDKKVVAVGRDGVPLRIKKAGFLHF